MEKENDKQKLQYIKVKQIQTIDSFIEKKRKNEIQDIYLEYNIKNQLYQNKNFTILSNDIDNIIDDEEDDISSSVYSPNIFPNDRSISQSSMDMAVNVSQEIWLITRLTAQLLWAFHTSTKWIIMFIRLIIFIILLLPAFLRIFYYWLYSPYVYKNINYGPNKRNLLDIYVPIFDHSTGFDSFNKYININKTNHKNKKAPVIVFFTGGAWIIGYKAWGSLMGKILSSCGFIFVTPDYRNFPQGIIDDMINDANCSMNWVFRNIHLFNGDPNNITLIGQSAGAHIGACLLIKQLKKEVNRNNSNNKQIRRHSISSNISDSTYNNTKDIIEPWNSYDTSSKGKNGSGLNDLEINHFVTTEWRASRLSNFIGISGPYNIKECLDLFDKRGLDKSITKKIMNNNIKDNSPTLLIKEIRKMDNCKEIAQMFPPITLFHGTEDKTIPYKITKSFGKNLRKIGVNHVQMKYYRNKSHTDPIIEDPIMGDDPLLTDIINIIFNSGKINVPSTNTPDYVIYKPSKNMLPHIIIKIARYVNPF